MNTAISIEQYPVTNAEYASWLKSLPVEVAAKHYCRLMQEHFFGGILEDYSVKPGFEKKPVVFVSFEDAQAYAADHGCRLPTAQEWKIAAAWLPEEKRFAKYCTGTDNTPTQEEAIFYDFENGWALPAPHLADVDWYRPSGPNGLCGMAGNVAEWCENGKSEGWKPALGGSVFRPVDFCRIDAGEADHPTKRLSTFGFRLVKEVC